MKLFFQRHWPVVCIFFLWFLFASPYFVKGLTPFPSDYLVTFFPPWSASFAMPVKNNAMPDVITQIYPWKKVTIDTWKLGQVPLWNPFSFSGTPHAGNYQSAIFSPFNLLFFILPFIDAWSFLILLQPLLAGLFMYLFVRNLGRSSSAAFLGSIAFMFCGFMVTWMAYGTLGYAVLWLPFIFWGIEKKNKFAISIGIALSLLSGHFQMSLYVIAAAVAYCLWKKRFSALLFIVVGVFIAMPQILLGIHSFLESTRSVGTLKGEVIPWTYLVTFLSPDFFGNPVTRNDWFGHYAEWGGFVGVVPLLLAFLAGEWFFIVLAIGSLLFALPTPLNDLLYILKVPVLSGSAASRIIILTSFSVAALSAYGLDALVTHWKGTKRKNIVIFSAVCIGFIASIWGILLIGKPFPVDKLAIAKHNLFVPSLLVFGTCFVFFFGFVKKRTRFIAVFILLVLSAFDLFRFSAKWMPFEPRQYVYPAIKSLDYLASHAGNDRVFGNIGNEVGSTYGIGLVEGYDAVYQSRYGEFINAVSKGYIYPGGRSVVQFDKYGLYRTEALQLLGVKYIYHRLSDGRNVWVFPFWEYADSMHEVYSDEQYAIYQYNNVYPRAFLASSYVVSSNDKDTIDIFFAKDFDRRNTLILEQKPAIEPASGSGSATITSYTPNKVKIETDSLVPKLLFLSDVYDKGWHATVDGKEFPIYRADYDFRAVALPTGKHTVEFSYKPLEFYWGIIVSMVGVLFLLKKRV